MRLILLRHAETDWNAAGRIQGRSDIPLNDRGREDAALWSLPPSIAPKKWVTSPQKRARETAAAMGVAADIEPSLAEMNWGDWEGRTLADLRGELGNAFAENEDRGLDFLPPGGESPRMVQQRVLPWLNTLARHDHDVGAISHKGVIRAIVALASGWNMIGKAPAKISSGTAQVISITPAGTMILEASDVRLSDKGDADDIE